MSNLIAACVGDTHVCPIKGHGSSPIMRNGSSILVEGKPIARVGDVSGCGAVITQGYPLALADGMPVAYLGSPTSHGGSIASGNQRVILGVATTTAPVVDFAMAGALDDKGQLTPAAKELLDKCLTANAAGAISEDECSSELSQVMEGSYLNAETNISKLETLYFKGTIEQDGSPTHRLSVYVPDVGTKFGEPDDGLSMGLGLREQGIQPSVCATQRANDCYPNSCCSRLARPRPAALTRVQSPAQVTVLSSFRSLSGNGPVVPVQACKKWPSGNSPQ